MVAQGHRAVLLFAVLHQGIKQVSAARHIDEKYAQLVDLAITKGVEVVAYKADISSAEITLIEKLTFN